MNTCARQQGPRNPEPYARSYAMAELHQHDLCVPLQMQHDVIALSKDTLGLDVVSCPFGFWIWWRAFNCAGDIGESTAKYSLRIYYAHYVHYAHYADYADYVLNA